MEFSSEEREMEIEALQSIYGEQFSKGGGRSNEPVFYEVKLEQRNTKIIFTIPEKYPDVPPSISILTQGSQPVYTELESLLYHSAHESCGEVMIYNLIEKAKSWLQKKDVTQQVPLQGKETAPEDEATICKFFLEGKCRFGNKCRNKHDDVTSCKSDRRDESLHSKISVDETEDVSTATDHKEMASGAPKSSNNSSGNGRHEKMKSGVSKKKPPMKTAGDVISRIKWDEELSPKDFTVGYLDRFTGIMEKCFADFSWEDLASVDHFVDLAIPRHRIQYFKYLGEIVWDKRERIDKVFGSTGSRETILDVKERIGVSSEIRATGLLSDPIEVSAIDDASCIASEPPKDLKEKSGPNYFIALQISNAEIIDNISKIQNAIQAELRTEAEYELTPSQGLHMTLLTLTLHNENEVTTAKHILKSVQPVLVSILPLGNKLRFNSLGQFNNRILYATIEPDASLSKLVQVLKFKFGKAGISLEGNRDVFVPHVTIMRGTSKDFSSHEHVQKTLSGLVKANHEIGDQSVQSLVLFSRFLPKDVDGTHHKISTVENSLKSLSSTLPKKLLQRVGRSFENEKLSEGDRDELEALFQSGDAVELDKGLTRLAELGGDSSEDKVVLIMRGISGSGKTYLVENSVEALGDQKGYAYCSARQLFYKTGGFAPDAAELNIAEAYCRSCVMDAMATERHFVVVDGVHAKPWEYAVYRHLAHGFGYACHVLEIRVTSPEDIKLCLQNSRSGVQLEDLLKAVQDWEDDPVAIVTEPWFHRPDVLKHETISLKQLIK